MQEGSIRMKKNIGLVLVVGSLMLLPACKPLEWIKDKLGFNKGKSEASADQAMSKKMAAGDEQVLVSMDGKAIISTASLEKDFEQLLEENPQYKQMLAFMPDAKYNFLQGLISQAIIDRYVADSGLDQKAEYKDELERVLRSMKSMLNTKYFSMEHPVKISDADIEKFYEDNKKTEQAFLTSRGGVKASAVSFDKEDAAKAFAAKVKGHDLAKVAKEAGLSAKVRDLMLVNPQSAGIDEAVKNKIVGITKVPAVEVVKGDDKAFWVVQATEKQNPQYRPLDQQLKVAVRQHLEQERRKDVVMKEINKLKEKYAVVINEEYFKKSQQVASEKDAAVDAQQAPQMAQQAAPRAARAA
jgi:hypothetical protein